MPRKQLPIEANWVPQEARLLCYQCGLKFPDERAKNHCRLCFDVFCGSCWGGTAHMPASYGYGDAQPVCGTCQLLMAMFPAFLAPLEGATGRGNLLPPNYCVAVLQSTVADDTAHVSPSPQGSPIGSRKGAGAASGGLLAQATAAAEQALKEEYASDTANGGGGCTGVRTRNGLLRAVTGWLRSGQGTLRGLHGSDLRSLSLGAFRPLSPDTRLCVGRGLFIPLRRLVDVTADGGVLELHVAPATGEVAAGEALELVRLLVGNVPGVATASLVGRTADVPTPEALHRGSVLADVEDLVFTADPDAARAVCESLRQMRAHTRRHFAFSRSAMCISQGMQAPAGPGALTAPHARPSALDPRVARLPPMAPTAQAAQR
jgi:hypothetical protein